MQSWTAQSLNAQISTEQSLTAQSLTTQRLTAQSLIAQSLTAQSSTVQSLRTEIGKKGYSMTPGNFLPYIKDLKQHLKSKAVHQTGVLKRAMLQQHP